MKKYVIYIQITTLLKGQCEGNYVEVNAAKRWIEQNQEKLFKKQNFQVESLYEVYNHA